jgi:hypothetical protein
MSTNAPPTRSNPLRWLIWGGALALWLLPLVASRFTTEVNWSIGDYVAWAVMLLVACGLYEIGTRMSGNTAFRAGTGLAVGAGFLMVWVNLAVGIIGSENNVENTMFFGILALGFVFAAIGRFSARGMVRSMIAMAVAQVAVGVAAAVIGQHQIWVFTAFYVGFWMTAAHLSRLSDEQQRAQPAAV